jgi:hypothetical protein
LAMASGAGEVFIRDVEHGEADALSLDPPTVTWGRLDATR